MNTRTTWLLALALAAPAWSAQAIERGKDGYYHTGFGTRVKEVAFIDVNVYEIHHYMKELPAKRSKQAVIEADVDKRIQWKMLRDVEAEKLQTALKAGYEMNGYKDAANIAKFTACMSKELTENTTVTISYDAEKKATTIQVQGAGTATVEGVDFMKATWSIWFGKIDQAMLGDNMMKLLP